MTKFIILFFLSIFLNPKISNAQDGNSKDTLYVQMCIKKYREHVYFNYGYILTFSKMQRSPYLKDRIDSLQYFSYVMRIDTNYYKKEDSILFHQKNPTKKIISLFDVRDSLKVGAYIHKGAPYVVSRTSAFTQKYHFIAVVPHRSKYYFYKIKELSILLQDWQEEISGAAEEREKLRQYELTLPLPSWLPYNIDDDNQKK